MTADQALELEAIHKAAVQLKLQTVYTAARALCMTHDWNNGATGQPARNALLKAVDAIEPVPDVKAKMKTSVAS